IYYAHSKNKSYYNLYDEHNKIDSDFSNGTRIYENNFASYFSAYKNWDKFSLTAGLRYKYVDYTSDKRIKTYSNLFPSLDLGYTFSEKLQSNLSYTRKISRPAFKDLDPSTIYVDTLTYFMGNTELKPEYFDNLQLNVVYNRYFVLSLGYSRMNNPIYMSVRLLEPSSKICIAITENLESENRYTLSLSTPYQYKFWSTYNSLGLMYHDNKFYIEGEGYNSSRGMFYAFSSQNFNLPKNFTFSFSYQYNSSGLNGIFTYDKRHVLNAGVSKSFLNDKLSLTLRYNDIFKGDKQRLRVDLKDMDFVYKAKYDASYFTFSVRYKFGTSLRKYVVKENTKEELKRIK
ncbi:MAG: outer membrane beta-barrel family protein, partial [Odoribacter sp.]|nr:outer membrane beta-barrel family protein [Odoribacter sp.]